MARSLTLPRAVTAVGALLLCARPGAAGDVLVEAEGQHFTVGSIGEAPLYGAGADVSNSLRLEGLAPALRLSLGLGATRRVELRWRRLSDANVYATADPDLVLQGEQDVSHDTLDMLLVQKLGSTPLRLELGYRHLGLERSWTDAVSVYPGLATLDYSSQFHGHGLRGALGVDVRLLTRLHLDAALGLSYVTGNERLRSLHADGSKYAESVPDRVSDGSRGVSMTDLLVRLRVDVGSRAWLATGYRYEAWYAGGESPEFSDGGLTMAVGFSLGRP